MLSRAPHIDYQAGRIQSGCSEFLGSPAVYDRELAPDGAQGYQTLELFFIDEICLCVLH